jgi:hypothetical protein
MVSCGSHELSNPFITRLKLGRQFSPGKIDQEIYIERLLAIGIIPPRVSNDHDDEPTPSLGLD